MTNETSPALAIELVNKYQYNKETTINEAIAVLEMLALRLCLGLVDNLPEAAQNGDCYLMNSQIAFYLNGWKLYAAKDFMEFTNQITGQKYQFNKKWSEI